MDVPTPAVKIIEAKKYLFYDPPRNGHRKCLRWLGQSKSHDARAHHVRDKADVATGRAVVSETVLHAEAVREARVTGISGRNTSENRVFMGDAAYDTSGRVCT
jgi:hypothetical protein